MGGKKKRRNNNNKQQHEASTPHEQDEKEHEEHEEEHEEEEKQVDETESSEDDDKNKSEEQKTTEIVDEEEKTASSSPPKPKPKSKRKPLKQQPKSSHRLLPLTKPIKRSYSQDLQYIHKLSDTSYRVDIGFVPNMHVPAEIFVNEELDGLLLEELKEASGAGGGQGGGFIPALKQACNVAALPGIVKASIVMPDVHAGYGFCIGNVAAFDTSHPSSIISPGGVGFDINCGVRLIRTNLTQSTLTPALCETLAQALFDAIPCGVGTKGLFPTTLKDLNQVLERGMDWSVEQGYAWPQDALHCEEQGRLAQANHKCISNRAKKRGLAQLGTLGGGNHYCEIQIIDEIYDHQAAKTMKIDQMGQVCIMLHSGSRGLGHQVATDALYSMEQAMARDQISLNDRQLACARIESQEGQDYLSAMAGAANYAWVNRSAMTYLIRKAFANVFQKSAEELEMEVVYDVSHNIAKLETHTVKTRNDDGEEVEVEKELLVHRKGATRAFPPHHAQIPQDYQECGQPVLVGGTMGTCSYVLAGTKTGMEKSFGSTCHGAGRALSRSKSRRVLKYQEVLGNLKEKGVAIRVSSPKLVTEEAPESYKDVSAVVETCEKAGVSRKVVRLRPIAVIKG